MATAKVRQPVSRPRTGIHRQIGRALDLLGTTGRTDVLIALGLFAGACLAAWALTGMADQITWLRSSSSHDVWFQADSGPVFSSMTDRYHMIGRFDIHPLFRLFTIAGTLFCNLVLGLDGLTAVRLMIAAAAGLLIALFYAAARLLGCRRPDSLLFSIVVATSSSALFWTAVPETYLFGALTIVITVACAALAERVSIPRWLDIGVAVAGLSVLVTNWMFPLASLLTRHRLRTACGIAGAALLLAAVLFAMQRLLVYSPTLLPTVNAGAEAVFLFRTSPVSVIRVFFLGGMVMPDMTLLPNGGDWPMLSVQDSSSWSLTSWGPVALISWTILLACGAFAMLTLRTHNRFRAMVALALGGQLALHLVYGEETFLYTLNWMPTVVLVTALATLTRLRLPALAAALVLAVTAGLHNWASLSAALDKVAAAAGAA